MSKHTSLEAISGLLDGEDASGAIGAAATSAALAQLRLAADAREAVSVYTLIGDALRGWPVADDGYSRRIIAALGQVRLDPRGLPE